jgi:hypothetical protein
VVVRASRGAWLGTHQRRESIATEGPRTSFVNSSAELPHAER